ncbi:MAG: EAL domain-containing protein, partial [Steroidobacteraceae bacterium]
AEVVHLIDEGTRTATDPVRTLSAAEGARPEHLMLVTRTGEEIAVQQSARPIDDPRGSTVGAVFVFRDVTRERHLKRALSYQANHDALTGLINRRELDRRLQAAVALAQGGEGQHALLYVDLDQFKLVNDTCGHQAGDRLMRDITGLLRTRVRATDSIARLGGDEFGILLADCTLEHAMHVAEGVRQAIHAYRFEWGATTLSVGASIGVVEIKRDTVSAASVLSAADIACYAAKEAGRNRIHVYSSGGASGREREMHWAARITRAVEEERLELHFQPIIAVAGTSHSFEPFHELMVRMRAEDGRLILPGEFIPAAERFNVMPAIDRWVILQAIGILKRRIAGSGAMPFLAVNLSGNSLSDQSFLDFVLEHAVDAGVARSLCFEITETAAVTNLSDAAYFMQELRGRGCRFALDDFGSGLSSFMYLRTLPVDFLKIDGQFVTHMATSPIDRSMIEAIASIGRALGIATVAECVESQAVLDELERIGVDFAQGYLFGRPRPVAELPGGASPRP